MILKICYRYNLWKQSFADVFEIGDLKNINIHRKTTALESLLIKLQSFMPETLLKRDSNTSVFLWILRNVSEQPLLNEYLWWLLLDLAMSTFNPLMHNTPKWSDTLKKSHSKCCKIVNVDPDILRRYVLCIIRECNDVKIGSRYIETCLVSIW